MQPHVVPISTYLKVAACLAVLFALTVGVAQFDLGYINTPAALLIAVAKAALIVLFFMHVRYGSPLVGVFAVGGFLWLAIMFTFVLSDVLTREVLTIN